MKKILTNEQTYQKNKKKAKRFKFFSPIVFYTFLLCAIIFIALTIKHSVGNVIEILDLLDKEKYTGEELKENYLALVEKWGEWEIVGRDSAGFVVRYVDIGNAFFSELMIINIILSCFFFVCAVLFGKIVFPFMAKHYDDVNDELVDMAALKSAAQIDELTKTQKKEWF